MQDINPGADDSWPYYFTVFNNKLYFSADDGTHGDELWSYDGTSDPTLVQDINPGADGSWPEYWLSDFTVFNNKLYFRADEGTHGDELWSYDGTSDPTLVQDINPGADSSWPEYWLSDFTVFNNKLYFSAGDGTHGYELWSYDGTSDPTLVQDIYPGAYRSWPDYFTVFNNKLYFSADDGTHGRELWSYDGTSDPTLVQDINPGADRSSLNEFTVFNNKLYFSADDGTHGGELWVVNEAPTSGNNTITLNEDGSHNTFAANDFPFTDPDTEDSGDSLKAVKITQVPTAGTFTLSGAAVTTNQVIAVADIPNLVFTPAANANGSNYANFKFKVNDGWEDSVSEYTLTFNVTAVNDAPTLSTVSKTGNEDTDITFTATDFTAAFADTDDDSLSKIKITSLPDRGTLKLNGTAVTENQEINTADLGNLVFTPHPDFNGNVTFTWNGYDGMAYSATDANVDLAIAFVNDAPTLSTVSKSGNEDTDITFTATDFTAAFTDTDNDSLSKIKITSLPDRGTLKLNGTAVTENQEINTADLGNLVFSPHPDFNGNVSFTWNGYDGMAYADNDANVDLAIAASNLTVDPTAPTADPPGSDTSGIPVAPAPISDFLASPDTSDNQTDNTSLPVPPPIPPFPTVDLVNISFTTMETDGADNIDGQPIADVISALDSNDFIRGLQGNDVLFGNQGNDELYGNQEADILNGNQGNDIIYNGKDNDMAFGGQDNDLMYGDLGSDSLSGDLGDDSLFGGISSPENMSGDGADLLLGGDGNDYLQGNVGNDSISGGTGNDTARGGKGNDLIHGDEGADILYGDKGNDSLTGNADNDVVYGGEGNDFLWGEAGDDFLYGDAGNDTLIGNDGADYFVIQSGFGADEVLDFIDGTDLIGLAAGLTFDQLSVTGSNGNTLISSNDELLVMLMGVDVRKITSADFTVLV